MRPDDTCSKTSRLVIDILREKHPECTIPTAEEDGSMPGFDNYVGRAPDFVPHASSKESVAVAAKKIQGSAGPSGIDAVTLQSWMHRYGNASENLREEWCKWVEWLVNESPPYAAYRALNARRGVALDKSPGTRPIHVGEIFMRLTGKETMLDCGEEAKIACGKTQLCAGLECGIEGSLQSESAGDMTAFRLQEMKLVMRTLLWRWRRCSKKITSWRGMTIQR